MQTLKLNKLPAMMRQICLRFADSDLTEDATGNISLSMVEFPDYQHSIEFVGT